jgi:hypothetical protein
VNYPSGYDLEEHAKAYYQYILSSSSDELEELWNQCHVDAGELLSSRDLKFDSSEFQGAQTILFGIRLLKRFADTVGADISQLPTDDEVADAFEHFADNIGNNGQRRGYGDIFLELFAQAAKNEYVERGEDYRFIQSQKWGEEVLAFHMPSVYAGVKRYVRDYNLEDEYNLIGKNDYISSFKDDIGDDSHVLKINHKARLGGGPTKCVVLNPSRTHQKLGTDFELRAFDEDAGEDGDESVESGVGRPIDDRTGKELKKISELDVGDSIETVSVEVETWDTDDSPLELDGCVRDVSGMINVVSFDEIVASVEEGDFVVLSNVSVSEFEGNKQLRIGSETEIVEIEEGTAFAPESSVESSQTSILSNMGEEA